MKKIKILFIVLAIIILTGCKGEYNLTINKDLSLTENVNLSIDNKDDVYDKTVKLFENNNIDESMYDIDQTEEYVNIKYKEEFKNFEDYFLNSKFYSRILSDEDYIKDNKKISYRGFSNLKLDDNVSNSNLNNSFYIENLKINLNVPFNVEESNADSVKDNTLTWILDEDDTYKMINFSFKYLRNNNLYLIVIILCSGIVLVTGFIFVRNYLKERGL